MRLGKFQKQPQEKLDYDIDFSEWLKSCGDRAKEVSVVADPGISIVSADVDTTTGIARVWVQGGTDGETYNTTIFLTTQAGRVKEVEVGVKVKNS